MPVLRINASTKLTVKGFYADVLRSLGDPNFAKGTQQQLEQKMQTFIRARGVELLVIDEVHHLMSAETHKVMWDVAELFKNILNDRTCCLVLSGIEKASFLFNDGGQLARRCITPVPLGPLDPTEKSDVELFQGFVFLLDERMSEEQVTDGMSGLANADVLSGLFEVSAGRLGIVWHVIEQALESCIDREGKLIDRRDLSRAIETWAIPGGFAKRNPFADGR